MSPDPMLTTELNALFEVEPPLRSTPEQVLAAARGRRRQRIAVASSAVGTVVLVGATAAAAAGLSTGPAPDRTGDGNGGGPAPTPGCVTRVVVPPPPGLRPHTLPLVTPAQPPPSAEPAASPSARPTPTRPGRRTYAPDVPVTPGAEPRRGPLPSPSRASDLPERMPTAAPPATPVPRPSAVPRRRPSRGRARRPASDAYGSAAGHRPRPGSEQRRRAPVRAASRECRQRVPVGAQRSARRSRPSSIRQ